MLKDENSKTGSGPVLQCLPVLNTADSCDNIDFIILFYPISDCMSIRYSLSLIVSIKHVTSWTVHLMVFVG